MVRKGCTVFLRAALGTVPNAAFLPGGTLLEHERTFFGTLHPYNDFSRQQKGCLKKECLEEEKDVF